MEENYFKLEIDDNFIFHFDQYEKYLEEHNYPIDKAIRIQNKIFDFVNNSLLKGNVNIKNIEGGNVR